jgi:hypothetical protein
MKNGIACKQVKIKELKEQHSHRHLSSIKEIISNSELSKNAKAFALDIFTILGEAESQVHNIPIEKIHFHEVGAIDSIIDICGAAYLIDQLDISKSYLNVLIAGKGFVNTAHGRLPVPCPATKLILEGIPYSTGDEEGEKLTPTGAAIIKYLNPSFEDKELIDIKTAYGSGEKEFKSPNALRLSIVEEVQKSDQMIIIETNIDDSNSEHLGFEFQSKLKEAGAYDFYFTQVIMKKGRPGLLLTIVCSSKDLEKISDFILNFTSTIGVRYYPTDRIELAREIKVIKTEFGDFRIKISKSKDGSEKIKPESEDVLNYSLKHGISPNIISQKILQAYKSEN